MIAAFYPKQYLRRFKVSLNRLYTLGRSVGFFWDRCMFLKPICRFLSIIYTWCALVFICWKYTLLGIDFLMVFFWFACSLVAGC